MIISCTFEYINDFRKKVGSCSYFRKKKRKKKEEKKSRVSFIVTGSLVGYYHTISKYIVCIILFPENCVCNIRSKTTSGVHSYDSGIKQDGRLPRQGRLLLWICLDDYDCIIHFCLLYIYSESTKQMEQTLRAKVKIFFKSENLKKCF